MRLPAILAIATVVAAIDGARPWTPTLRDFDPHELARLETGMWRDYYDHRRAALFAGLAAALRTQYGKPFAQSWITAYHGAKAAVVFQRGQSRADYEQALPDLERFYAAIRAPKRAAKLELEWWMLHRERSPKLDSALAELQAEIYGVPAERLAEHARLRAEAMRLRDAGGDWQGSAHCSTAPGVR